MNNSIRAIAAALASMTLSAGLANAKVPEEEVAKLGVEIPRIATSCKIEESNG